MVGEILMGFDESTMAYDLQRAHSADIWFIRARFWLWGIISTVTSFCAGHLVAHMGYNMYEWLWGGMVNFWNHLW
tara:strand:- start:1009 stop:1233 length:225 start_codon:yes stop_codon:yes gene_type:complete